MVGARGVGCLGWKGGGALPHISGVADDVRQRCRSLGVRSLQLQFTDILGVVKHVTVPIAQLDKALSGAVIVDGSALEGFVRTRESDMYLRPDPRTFSTFPWKAHTDAAAPGPSGHGRQDEPPAVTTSQTGRLICDLYNLDGEAYAGDPRHALRRACAAAEGMGFTPMVGAEPEFFLFRRDAAGRASTETNDLASYFDMGPLDMGEGVREEIVATVEEMGFDIASSHHEAAPGQHEVDFKYSDALAIADDLITFRLVARSIAAGRGLHATFMPKPLGDVNGSGLHIHVSLFHGADNAFHDPDAADGLSGVARQFLAGVLVHARGFTAVTNPLVNSYKRLVPGYEAPIFATWSQRDHSPLVRVPARRGVGTRIELRSPDPSCNPYLALAAIIAAGLDGLQHNLEPPRQTGAAVYRMSAEERQDLGIVPLPGNLEEALAAMETDVVVQEALGEHITSRFTEAKRIEWDYYRRQVHKWEIDQYLSAF